MGSILVNLVKTLLTCVISYAIYKMLLRLFYELSYKFRKELKLKNTIRLILGLLVGLIALMVILNIWQVNLIPYLTAYGVAGVVIGLALQEPLVNFFSGLLVLVTGKLSEGKVVDIEGTTGTVEVIHFNYTILRTFDGRKVIIPNRQVWNSKVIDFWPDSVRRVSIKVGVPYDSNIEKVVQILKKCIEEEPLVVKENVTNFVDFSAFSSSSIDFEVFFWVRRESFFEAKISLANRIKQELEKEGIKIPYPQLDVHIKKEDGA
ncbi:mechanosensitive ion channel family protein [Pseudothermotoga thermarum]|uniref:MscS Mechanosensitive ion channel n=1 Tax=Pseudothermotoga thermarum DSM 5069 TaxID=688269 RepID=F7YYL4_9THEM|nr:mechanosensitive ion channel family protein [Pseudothermotoga thermarum]AEH51046.1 MscS Mechanosensitive ion channel [Pseudothermotoga thermarum DSM 5069]